MFPLRTPKWSCKSSRRSAVVQRSRRLAVVSVFTLSLLLGIAISLPPDAVLAGDALGRVSATKSPYYLPGISDPQSIPRPARVHGLSLSFRYGEPGDADRMQQKAAQLLLLAATVEQFECRLASECLTSNRPKKIHMDGPFEDVLVGLPARGQAHVDAVLRIEPVPHSEIAVIHILVEGTAHLHGVTHSQGVRVGSDFNTEFKAMKRVVVDHNGFATMPATCTAQARLSTNQISSSRPRLMGRITENVARQRVSQSHAQAEAEANQHFNAALASAVDREFDKLAAGANTALRDHLAAASGAERARWQRTRFATEAGCVRVSRPNADQERLVAKVESAEGRPLPAVVVRLPREKFDMTRLLGSLSLLSAQSPAAKLTSASFPESTARAMRPQVSVQDDVLTLSLHLEPELRVAQEPVVGAAQ